MRKIYANRREQRQALKAKYRSEGRCPSDGKPAVPGKKMCQTCLDRMKANHRLKKASNVCQRCLAPTTGTTRCEACMTQSRREAKERRKLYAANGWCYACKKPVSPGHRFCERHLKALNEHYHRPATHSKYLRTIRTVKYRFSRAQKTAARRTIAWALTHDIYESLIKLPCHYCGGKLEDAGVGLDRKDNAQGYTVENSVPCCLRCNRTKSDHFTYDEMVYLSIYIQEIDKRRLASQP